MIAYFVHDPKTGADIIVIPEMNCAVPADRRTVDAFISPNPVFAEWSGDACAHVSPEQLGKVAATREEDGDVCVVDEALWRKRMEYHLSRAR